jgi:hypothetical protein
LLWLSSESEMVNFRSAIGGSLLLGVRSAARAPLELQPVDTSTGYECVGEKTKIDRMLGRWPASSQLRAQMSVGALPQRTRVVQLVLHSAEAQHLKQSVPGRSAFESKEHATVYSRSADSRRLAAPLGRAWWHFGDGEDRGCVVGLEALFDHSYLAERRDTVQQSEDEPFSAKAWFRRA